MENTITYIVPSYMWYTHMYIRMYIHVTSEGTHKILLHITCMHYFDMKTVHVHIHTYIYMCTYMKLHMYYVLFVKMW